MQQTESRIRLSPLHLSEETSGLTTGTGNQLYIGGLHEKIVVPMVFIPGVTGTRLRNRRNEKAWDPDDLAFMLGDYGLPKSDAAHKKEMIVGGEEFDPDFLHVLDDDAHHNLLRAAETHDLLSRTAEYLARHFIDIDLDSYRDGARNSLQKTDREIDAEQLTSLALFMERGWGGVSWGTYGTVLQKLQSLEELMRKNIVGMLREGDSRLTLEEMQVAADRLSVPVYAHGYNWTDSNAESGKKLSDFIDGLVEKYDSQDEVMCDGVILVTHSTGGLVARAACKLHGAESKVLGVIHGVQPASGSPAFYWRIKAGFERPGFEQVLRDAGLLRRKTSGTGEDGPPGRDSLLLHLQAMVAAGVLGGDGREVTALLGNIPGGLELLCPSFYETNDGSESWLHVVDRSGKASNFAMKVPASGDPYGEIYRKKGAFWHLIDPELLVPEYEGDTSAVDKAWKGYLKRIDNAEEFHSKLGKYYHPRTYNFYGTGGPRRVHEDPAGNRHIIDTLTADRVVFEIRPNTWQDQVDDRVEKTLQEVKDKLGDTVRTAIEDGEMPKHPSVDISDGRNVLNACHEALETGKDAIDSALGMYRKSYRAFGEALKASKEAIEAGADAVLAARSILESVAPALERGQALTDALRKMAAHFGDALEVLLDRLEEDSGDLLPEGAIDTLRKGRTLAMEALNLALNTAERAYASALEEIETSVRQIAESGDAAITSGKRALEAAEDVIAKGLKTGRVSVEEVQQATRGAVAAGQTALRSGVTALIAGRRIVVETAKAIARMVRSVDSAVRTVVTLLKAGDELLRKSADAYVRGGGNVDTTDYRTLQEVLQAYLLARSAVEAVFDVIRAVATATEEAIEKADEAVRRCEAVFEASGEAFGQILAATAETMEKAGEQADAILEKCRKGFPRDAEKLLEEATEILNEGREIHEEDWPNLSATVEEALMTFIDQLRDRPSKVIEQTWDSLPGEIREGLTEAHELAGSELIDLMDAAEETVNAAGEAPPAAGEALGAGDRLVGIGSEGLISVLIPEDEEDGDDDAERSRALQKGPAAAAKTLIAEVSDMKLIDPDTEDDMEDAGDAGTDGDDSKVSAGELYVRYKSGGFEIYFLADDGTLLRGRMLPPSGSGDGTVPASSGQFLGATQIASLAGSDGEADLESICFPLTGIMHEPAFEIHDLARNFAVSRVIEICREKVDLIISDYQKNG